MTRPSLAGADDDSPYQSRSRSRRAHSSREATPHRRARHAYQASPEQASHQDLREELEAWREGTKEYFARLPARSLRAVRKVAGYDVAPAARAAGRGLKSAYHESNLGKDLVALGGTAINTVVGMPLRLVRGLLNIPNYIGRGVAKTPDLVAKLGNSLERKIDAAQERHEKYITFTHSELESLHYLGADQAIHHLSQKLLDAENRQGQIRVPLKDGYSALQDIWESGKTDRLHKYRAGLTIISFIVALLSLDQVSLTGFSVAEASGYDYYSLFGFVFLGISILLLFSLRKR